jgi:hypothetical protein
MFHVDTFSDTLLQEINLLEECSVETGESASGTLTFSLYQR